MKSYLLALLLLTLTHSLGCISTPLTKRYPGPAQRPADLVEYYEVDAAVTTVSSTVLDQREAYDVHRIQVGTAYGPITIDYFSGPVKSDSLIFVFPVLGGKNIFANHFANYFAERGLDAAIVHRNNEFKQPENFTQIEEVLRRNVLRDRIAIDVFERVYGKKRFGSFGISRGAINASITAGIDPRLEYNVFALGGADLVNVFRYSQENGIERYRKKVKRLNKISDEEFFAFLRRTLRTDPDYVAGHIDARKTLMFLSVFDSSVPFEYGLKLRARIGNPKTIFLLSGHYTALAYTQFVPVFPPTDAFSVFPLDYVESEAVAFYREMLGRKDWSLRTYILKSLQAPMQLIAELIRTLTPD